MVKDGQAPTEHLRHTRQEQVKKGRRSELPRRQDLAGAGAFTLTDGNGEQGGGGKDQVTDAAVVGGGAGTSTVALATSSVEGQGISSTSAVAPLSSTTSMTGVTRTGAITPSSASSSATPSSTRAPITSTVVVPPTSQASPTTSQGWIFVNSFPSGFPVDTATAVGDTSPGRGYIFLQNNQVGDNMLLLLIIVSVFSLFTFLLIPTAKLLEGRRGLNREDRFVDEGMKWAEGREVLERKIVRDERGDGTGGKKGRKVGPSGFSGLREKVPDVPSLPGEGGGRGGKGKLVRR